MNRTNTRFLKPTLALALVACASGLLSPAAHTQEARPDPERAQEMSLALAQQMFADDDADIGLSATVEFTCTDSEQDDVTITANYSIGAVGDHEGIGNWSVEVDATSGLPGLDRVTECLRTHFETLETGVSFIDSGIAASEDPDGE